MSSSSKPNPIHEALKAALNSGPALKREDAFYKPRPQSYYHHDGTSWISSPPSAASTASSKPVNPRVIRLISWNIDMLVPFAEERMEAALSYLSSLVDIAPPETPIVVFLQEMSDSDLKQIQEASWIQSRFYITDIAKTNWLSPYYGTTTLVDRRLKISDVFRVPYLSKFDRDGLFVDIPLSSTLSGNGELGKVLRLCNTHLESLAIDPPLRPSQMQSAAKHLHSPNVGATLLAGDLNAIQPFDRTLHFENDLQDAYLELGGQEDSDDGYTWGYQVPDYLRGKFGCSRMDKILFKGTVAPKAFERIGVGIKVAEEKRKEVTDAGELEWVTDHYGVMGDFDLESCEMGVSEGLGISVAAKLA